MKKYIAILIMFGCILPALAQRTKILDELKQELIKTTSDTAKVHLMADISEIYGFFNADSSLIFAEKGLKLAQKLKFTGGEIRMLYCFGTYYRNTGDLPEALKYFNQTLLIATKNKIRTGIARGNFGIGLVYSNLDPVIAIRADLRAREMIQSGDNSRINLMDRIDINLGLCYISRNMFDSASVYLDDLYNRLSPEDFHYPPALLLHGFLQSKSGYTNEAIRTLNKGVALSKKENDHFTASDYYYYLAEI